MSERRRERASASLNRNRKNKTNPTITTIVHATERTETYSETHAQKVANSILFAHHFNLRIIRKILHVNCQYAAENRRKKNKYTSQQSQLNSKLDSKWAIMAKGCKM